MGKIRSRDASRIQDRRGEGGRASPMGIPGGLPMGGGLVGIVVVLAALFLPRLLGGEADAPALSPSDGQTEDRENPEACQTEQEQILCGGTNDVQDFWERSFPSQFEGREYEPTETVFFSGFTNTGCGQASSETGPFYCPLDNLIYFDLDFLAQLQQQFDAEGDLAAQYIVAHEYGHHIQNILGINSQVQQAQQQDRENANSYSVALELQADCLAGVWANDADRRLGLGADEIEEAINAAEAVGDDRIQQQTQGRLNPESFTHGTSEQRATWFRRGYSTGSAARCDTFAELL